MADYYFYINKLSIVDMKQVLRGFGVCEYGLRSQLVSRLETVVMNKRLCASEEHAMSGKDETQQAESETFVKLQSMSANNNFTERSCYYKSGSRVVNPCTHKIPHRVFHHLESLSSVSSVDEESITDDLLDLKKLHSSNKKSRSQLSRANQISNEAAANTSTISIFEVKDGPPQISGSEKNVVKNRYLADVHHVVAQREFVDENQVSDTVPVVSIFSVLWMEELQSAALSFGTHSPAVCSSVLLAQHVSIFEDITTLEHCSHLPSLEVTPSVSSLYQSLEIAQVDIVHSFACKRKRVRQDSVFRSKIQKFSGGQHEETWRAQKAFDRGFALRILENVGSHLHHERGDRSPHTSPIVMRSASLCRNDIAEPRSDSDHFSGIRNCNTSMPLKPPLQVHIERPAKPRCVYRRCVEPESLPFGSEPPPPGSPLALRSLTRISDWMDWI